MADDLGKELAAHRWLDIDVFECQPGVRTCKHDTQGVFVRQSNRFDLREDSRQVFEVDIRLGERCYVQKLQIVAVEEDMRCWERKKIFTIDFVEELTMQYRHSFLSHVA